MNKTEKRIIECIYCGESEDYLNTRSYERKVLFVHHFGEGRKPTCKRCEKKLSKNGYVPCPSRCNHHTGSYCSVCNNKSI